MESDVECYSTFGREGLSRYLGKVKYEYEYIYVCVCVF